jgi:hypothetical protein
MNASREIEERGFTVFERLLSEERVAALRAPIARRYAELGSPATYARPPLEPAPGVEISPVGMVFHELGKHFPDLGPLLFAPEVLDAARGVLGPDMYLEYTGAVVAHGERPFFAWHAHMGGVDNIRFRKEKIFPSYAHSERVTGLIYLDDIDESAGALRVHPRRVTDPTEPPYDPTELDWEGQVELLCDAGTVVLLEQATWHAAMPKRSDRLRAFIAFYLTSAAAPRPSWIDDSFREVAKDDPTLSALMAPRDP